MATTRHQDGDQAQARQAGHGQQHRGGQTPAPGGQEGALVAVEAALPGAHHLQQAKERRGENEHQEEGRLPRPRILPDEVRAEENHQRQPGHAMVEEPQPEGKDQRAGRHEEELVEQQNPALRRVAVAGLDRRQRLVEIGMEKIEPGGQQEGIARRVIGVGQDARRARRELVGGEKVARPAVGQALAYGVVAQLRHGMRAQELGGEAAAADDLARELRVVHRLLVIKAAEDLEVRPEGDDDHGRRQRQQPRQDGAAADLHHLQRTLDEIHAESRW